VFVILQTPFMRHRYVSFESKSAYEDFRFSFILIFFTLKAIIGIAQLVYNSQINVSILA